MSVIRLPTYALVKDLSKLLQPHIGQTQSYIWGSTHRGKLKTLEVVLDNLLVSFDMVLLYTMVTLRETLEHVGRGLHQVLTTTVLQ